MRLNIRVEGNLDDLNEEIKARLSRAVGETVKQVTENWINAIKHAPLSPYDKDNYVKSLQQQTLSPYAAEVFTDYRLAGEIEQGRPQRDLKKALNTSNKVRISHSKKHPGQKYLIIPFRHNTPGNNKHASAMPPEIYAKAKALEKSRVLSMGMRPSQQAQASAGGYLYTPYVAQAKYQWGGRLEAGLAPKLKEHHTTDIYAGMTRFNTSSGKQKSSQYLTFRIMGEWQTNKWLIPEQPGLKLAEQATEGAQETLEWAVGKILGNY